MRKLTVVLVAAMILLAGCSGGGGGAASPTEEAETDAPASGTPMETATDDSSMEETMGTPTPDDDDGMGDDGMGGDDSSQSGAATPLSALESDDPFEGATEIDGTVYNASQETTALIRNDTDTERELVELTRPGMATSSVYTTSDYVAYRNGTTAEVQYGGPDSRIGSGVGFAAGFTAIGALFYVGVVEWEQTGTTTVDGENALVYESDALNQTALDQQSIQFDFQESEVQSVDGRIVITSAGRIHSVSIVIETADGTFGGDMSVGYDDITIDKPSWVDESQAP